MMSGACLHHATPLRLLKFCSSSIRFAMPPPVGWPCRPPSSANFAIIRIHCIRRGPSGTFGHNEDRGCGPSPSTSGSAVLTYLVVGVGACPSNLPWKTPLRGSDLSEFCLLHLPKCTPSEIEKTHSCPSHGAWVASIAVGAVVVGSGCWRKRARLCSVAGWLGCVVVGMVRCNIEVYVRRCGTWPSCRSCSIGLVIVCAVGGYARCLLR